MKLGLKPTTQNLKLITYHSSLSTFRRLLKLAAPFKGWIVLAALLGFAAIGSSIGLMATSAYIIAKAALQPSIAVLQVSIVGVRFFGLSRGLARYAERYVSHQVTFRLLARLRVWFYRAVEPLAPARLLQYRSGDLLSRIVADIDSLEFFYVRVMAPPLVAGLVLLLTGILLAAFDVRLAAITLLFLALAGVGLPLLTQRLGRDLGRRLVTTRGELDATLIDGIQGAADLLLAGRAADYRQRVARLSQTLTGLQERQARQTGLQTALAGLLMNGSTLAVLLIAIPLVNQGLLDGVYLALVALAALAGFEAVTPLPEAWQHLGTSLAAARRLFELIDAEPPVPNFPAGSPSPAPAHFGLVVKNLSFRYGPEEPPALHNISFEAPAGQKVAIVGPSGAGKSTLLQLLLRFWDYQQGEIWLGGHELRQYPPDEVRRWVSVVSQHTHLFNGTIRENLLLARPGATAVDLIEAAKQAQLHHFIQSLPQGYETWIGEQGLRLSGGERQRLAIARALLKDAPLLILDEATANLDPLTGQALLQLIYSLTAGRTTLMITHRLAGLEAMDRILVLQAGQIVEQGRHQDLVSARGLYRRMWQYQQQTLALAQ
ncbi:MAG: thiol reductant ABC exporter subunit CydC [Chloroflexota bacterium]